MTDPKAHFVGVARLPVRAPFRQAFALDADLHASHQSHALWLLVSSTGEPCGGHGEEWDKGAVCSLTPFLGGHLGQAMSMADRLSSLGDLPLTLASCAPPAPDPPGRGGPQFLRPPTGVLTSFSRLRDCSPCQ